MIRRWVLAISLMALVPAFAFADNIPFSGSGSSGTIQTGQPFLYGFDTEFVWGLPGDGHGLTTWNGPLVGSFDITFNLPDGVVIDPAMVTIGQQGDCVGGAAGGTAFCAQPFTQPWIATLVDNDTIEFTASPGNYLTPGDPFFVNIFFSGGDPAGASFEGNFGTTVPEPSSWVLLGTGVLGIAAYVRRRKL